MDDDVTPGQGLFELCLYPVCDRVALTDRCARWSTALARYAIG